MNINRISPSRYELYTLCPQKYKYKYHLQQASTTPEPFYFIYGKIVHKIAELYAHNKGNKLITEVASDVLSGKETIEDNKQAPPLPLDYKNRLPGHLRSIKKICEKMGFEGELEYKFKYDLEPPNGRFLEGVIDRFILKDDKCWIIDYKTTKEGNFRKNSITITSDIQMRAYAFIIWKQFNIKPENIKLALYYLEGGDLVGVQYTEKSLIEVEKILLEIHKKIENHSPDEVIGNYGRHCSNCEYNNVCPFFRRK